MKRKNLAYWIVGFFVMSIIAIPTVSAGIYPEGMISYWMFDEGSGAIAIDSVGANDGIINGPTWTTGMVGGALSFDGSDDLVDVGYISSPNNITLEAWVKLPSDYSVDSPIITKEGGVASFNLALRPYNQPRFLIAVNGNWWTFLWSPGLNTINVWNHIVGTYDGSTMKIYVNGVLKNALGLTGTINEGGARVYIGYNNDIRYLKGIIDEVAIYDRVLTPEEIQQHYQNGLLGFGYEGPPVADAGGPYMVALGNSIKIDGTCTDSNGQDTLSFLWTPAGNLDDATLEDPTYRSDLLTSARIENLTFNCEDSRYNSSSGSTIVVVYDPSGGFVTGGGWIYSDPGAYLSNPALEGKANFGFVSKYKKGAEVPTGNTEFQFHTASLNFHSDSYEWLVVTGGDYARFKGEGTINDEGNYKFMLWAGDGTGTDGEDTFRIKIWTEDELTAAETVIYDNGFDQAIEGGSIVVHTKKK